MINTLTDAQESLASMGYCQIDALTKIDQLIKIGGVDYALVTIEEMESNFYAKDFLQSIFQGNDGRFHIFIKLSDGKRKHMVSQTRRNLESKIVDYVKSNLELVSKPQSLSCTFKDLFPDFISLKMKETSPGTANKLSWAYNRYIKDSDIETMDMDSISIIQLKEFCLDKIEEYKLTSKGYKELKSLLNALFGYAVDLGLIQINTAKQMSSINTRKLTKVEKTAETQVFTKEEEIILYEEAFNRYKSSGNTSYLAIILSGCLGVRVGELVALKELDFDLDTGEVSIRRQEIVKWKKNADGKLERNGFEVVDYLKTDESRRDLPITEPIRRVLALIKAQNRQYGASGGYLFISPDGERKHSQSVSMALRRANKGAGLIQRSNHKLRKTLLSELEHEIGATKTRAYAGHSRNSITLEQNYLYLTNPLSEETSTIEDVINERMPALL